MTDKCLELEIATGERAAQSPKFNDRSALAPESDLSHEYPELDKKAWPLQSSPTSDSPAYTPQGLDFKSDYNDAAPEHVSSESKDREGLKGATGPSPPQASAYGPRPGAKRYKKERRKPRRRRGLLLWTVIGLGILTVLAIALGVGLGLGMRKHQKSESSSPAPPAVVPHAIFNDTSVAVVALGNGNKRLFFQEGTGNIREALYTRSTNSWTAHVNNIVATNARSGTPLAALLANNPGVPFAHATGPVLFLFYIANNNRLASVQFISGYWASRDNFSPTGNGNTTFDTAMDTRALACTTIANSTRSGEALVFYVAGNGTVATLAIMPNSDNSITASPGPALPRSLQGGHVLALVAGLANANNAITPQVGVLTSTGTVYYELYFSFYNNSAWTAPELQTLLVPALPSAEQITRPTSLTIADAYPASATQAAPTASTTDFSSRSAASNESSIGDVNIAQVFLNDPNSHSYTLFGFWVNGTSLAAYTTRNVGLNTQPQSPFPSSRLAATMVENGSEIFLYHQLNGSAVAEDVYHLDGGSFTSNYFRVATRQ